MHCGCPSPVRDGVCSPAVGVETLRVRFDQAPLPLSACPAPAEVVAEASVEYVFTEDLGTAYVGIHGSAQQQPKVVSLSLLCLS